MWITFLIAAIASLVAVICGFLWGFGEGAKTIKPISHAVELGCVRMLHAAAILERDDVSQNEIRIAHEAIVKALTELQNAVPGL